MNSLRKIFSASERQQRKSDLLGDALLEALRETNIDAEKCRGLIGQGAKLDKKTHDGWTPLTLAVYRTRGPDLVQALIDAGAPLDQKGRNGWTPLHWSATFDGRPEAMKALIKAGADINAKTDEGWTPLMLAAEGCPHECLKILIESGADLDLKKSDQQTAIDIARGEEGSKTAVDMLEIARRARDEAVEKAKRDALKNIDVLAHTGSGKILETAPLPLIRKQPFSPAGLYAR